MKGRQKAESSKQIGSLVDNWTPGAVAAVSDRRKFVEPPAVACADAARGRCCRVSC